MPCCGEQASTTERTMKPARTATLTDTGERIYRFMPGRYMLT
jgi:hypothetical protein